MGTLLRTTRDKSPALDGGLVLLSLTHERMGRQELEESQVAQGVLIAWLKTMAYTKRSLC